MKTLFNYCYYRISKAYKVLDDKDFCMYGSLVVFGSLGLYALSLVSFAYHLLDKKLSTTLIGVILVSFGLLSLFFISKKRYIELEKIYKDEIHHKLKGWLVLLYVIGSIVLYIVSINVFDV